MTSAAATTTTTVRAVLFEQAGGNRVPLQLSIEERARRECMQAIIGSTLFDTVTLILPSAGDDDHLLYLAAYVHDSGVLIGLPRNSCLPQRPNGSYIHGPVVLVKARDTYGGEADDGETLMTLLDVENVDVTKFVEFIRTGRAAA